MRPTSRRGRRRSRSPTGREWGRRTDTGVCEVARDTARRLGLPDRPSRRSTTSTSRGPAAGCPTGCKGDDIAIASRVARAAMDAAFFGQLGGVDAAVTALRPAGRCAPRPGGGGRLRSRIPRPSSPRPTTATRATASSTSNRSRSSAQRRQLRDVAAAFGDLADVKVPFLHGHARRWPGWLWAPPAGSVSTTRRSAASSSPVCCTTSAGSASPTPSGRSRRR